jgi:hypothetical protein
VSGIEVRASDSAKEGAELRSGLAVGEKFSLNVEPTCGELAVFAQRSPYGSWSASCGHDHHHRRHIELLRLRPDYDGVGLFALANEPRNEWNVACRRPRPLGNVTLNAARPTSWSRQSRLGCDVQRGGRDIDLRRVHALVMSMGMTFNAASGRRPVPSIDDAGMTSTRRHRRSPC